MVGRGGAGTSHGAGPGDETLAGAFAHLLAGAGIHEALASLNARQRFRFTGVYRPEPPMLRNLHLFDRENPTLNVSGGVRRFDETYCSIACLEDRAFGTGDARRDAGLSTHAARASVISYLGVPIRDDAGQVIGTLCHYDVRPRLLPEGEATVLEQVAPVLALWIRERAASS